MNIETLTLGALSTNCYLVYDTTSGEAIVIDPADEAVFIAEKLQRLNLKLKAIIATHGHFDHVLAAGELQLIYPDSPFYIHTKDMFLLKKMNSSASHWLKTKENRPFPQIINFLKNQTHRISRYTLCVLQTPGHTPGSICLCAKYKIQDTQYEAVFTGDTLFKGAVGRTDFSYSDPKKLVQSLHKLFTLPERTLVYPGHGEITTIGKENTKIKTLNPK